MTNNKKVKTIVNFLLDKFPIKNQEIWDKSGLIFGKEDRPINSVVIALDLTPEVFQLAIENDAQLIIVHHPFIFNDDIEMDFEEAPYKKEICERIINTNISVLSLHTNYDKTNRSTATQIAKIIDLEPTKSKLTYGHMFEKELDIDEINQLFSEKMGLSIIETNVKQFNKFKKWAILPGSGAPQDIIQAKNNGAELVVVSDIKWSTWVMAGVEKIGLAQISHKIESVFVNDISKILRKKFKEIKINQY